MPDKKLITILMFIGATVGSYVPNLWGAGLFSFSSIIGGFLGGVIGIYLAFKIVS